MPGSAPDRGWFWSTLVLSSITIVTVVFAAWELVENHFFRSIDYVTLHYLYITRGVLSSLLLAVWAAWYVLRQRRRSEEELRQSRERYRGLLEASPGAVCLFDKSLVINEWNAAAERLYGFSKAEVYGRTLPTVPVEKQSELRAFLAQVEAGKPVLDAETLRQDQQGAAIEVQLNLLPFRDSAGREYFLEVTADIRERVRLRQKLLEIEKLATVGQMAAGTAHHLNTPLAAMLLRIQMMRERMNHDPCQNDLERLEAGLRLCHRFVQRLLEFSRRAPAQKQPQELTRTVESVVNFYSPTIAAKGARVAADLSGAQNVHVLADGNLLEALFSILLSNGLDAVERGGILTITSGRPSENRIEIRIADDGCGIEPANLPRIFEPFFTTKPPGQGTGLGLAIARNIIVEHGGVLRLESIVGRGTTAFIELPLHHPAPALKDI